LEIKVRIACLNLLDVLGVKLYIYEQ